MRDYLNIYIYFSFINTIIKGEEKNGDKPIFILK